jgi:hypothetical protein
VSTRTNAATSIARTVACTLRGCIQSGHERTHPE